jgi:uncharacterized protein (DUF427 family)
VLGGRFPLLIKPFTRVSTMTIAIKERASSAILASGELGSTVIKYEGNLYFDPAAVDTKTLHVTSRTYTCPFKGVCNWVDFVTADGRTVPDVAWFYPEPKPGHEVIKGRYGFYSGARKSTYQEG